jgi:ribonuclease Z
LISILVLGSGSATPCLSRNPAGILVKTEQSSYLVDCGEGTQLQLRKFKESIQRINQIFISHLHADHFLGLFGLLSTQGLLGRERALEVYAPKGMKEIIDVQLKMSGTYLCYELRVIEVDTKVSSLIFETNDMEVFSVPLNHKIDCAGFVFKEKVKERKLIPAKITQYSIPIYMRNKIKKGEDLITEKGKVIPNKELTQAPPKSFSFAYLSDTKVLKEVPEVVKEVDMLYHEATFLHELLDRANKTYHSTALQAAEFAAKANVGKLILGHFSARYIDLQPFIDEASPVFSNVKFAIDGKEFSPDVDVLI